MTEHGTPRGTAERPASSRRHAFASGTPHNPPIPAASSAAVTHIPDKLYFRIGEVARLCDVQAYVLRFWETEFPQLRPHKGGSGQRLFRRRDVEIALRIRHLLYNEGYTIPGARQLLKSEARQREPQLALVEDSTAAQLRRDRLLSLYRGLCDLHALVTRTTGPTGGSLGTPRQPTTLPPPLQRPPSRRSSPTSGSLFAAPDAIPDFTP